MRFLAFRLKICDVGNEGWEAEDGSEGGECEMLIFMFFYLGFIPMQYITMKENLPK